MRYLKLFEDFQEVDNPHGGEFNYGKLTESDITKIKVFIEDLKLSRMNLNNHLQKYLT